MNRFILSSSLLAPLFSLAIGASELKAGEWLSWGKDDTNAKYASEETVLNKETAKKLKTDWVFDTRSNVYVFPTIKDDWLYVTDFPLVSLGSVLRPEKEGGYLYALDKNTGALRWEHSIFDYSGNSAKIVSRNSPAIFEDTLIFGDALNAATVVKFFADAKTSIYAVDRFTGKLKWKTVVEDHNASQITQSPTVHDGVIYVGVSSQENVIPGALGLLYPCCTFRGSMLAIDARNGKILWKTYTVPEVKNQKDGFSGASVWGSSPSIDTKRGLVYVATGNNYNAPKDFKDCLNDAKKDAAKEQLCYEQFDPADNYFDAVLALDMKTGEVKWSKKVMQYDVWNFSCLVSVTPLPNPIDVACPKPQGSDDDFAQAPILIRDATINGTVKDIIVLGQKTGVFWAFDPDNGDVVWTQRVGPDGIVGGHEFGSATDGKRIYVQITNIEHHPIDLVAGPQAGQTTKGGLWAALEVGTGKVLWQTPVPNGNLPLAGNIDNAKYGKGLGLGFFAVAQGPLSTANGVVYAGSLDGNMYAMDAETGAILWSQKTDGSINSAPSIVDGSLYWGSGYAVGFPDHKLYKFSPSAD